MFVTFSNRNGLYELVWGFIKILISAATFLPEKIALEISTATE